MKGNPLNNEGQNRDIYAWLRLIRSEQVGPITFWQLLNRYGSAAQALAALSDSIAHGKAKGNDGTGKGLTRNLSRYRLASETSIADELAAHEEKGFILLPAYQPSFPQMLRHLPDCPPVLSVYGQVSILNQPTIGIVGSRNASLHGRQLAECVARDLGKAGWKIASGLARGIDRFAHQGALAQGTIAVVAGGADIIYPPEHKELYRDIARTGAIISEMPLSMFPDATHFPRRNRLISGLSKGVVIVEAALKSGSLITARMALEQGRELFAVPGSPADPRCRGTNDLLRQGAGLVESAADVLAMMGSQYAETPGDLPLADPAVLPSPTISVDWDTLAKDIFQDLSLTPIALETLVQRHDVPAQSILTLMLEWELQGRIHRYAGNKVALAP